LRMVIWATVRHQLFRGQLIAADCAPHCQQCSPESSGVLSKTPTNGIVDLDIKD